SMKEYLMTPGATVIIDDDQFHQYFLVTLHRQSGPVKVIAPGTGRETSEVLTARGLEPIEIGGRSVTVTKYSLGSSRQIWVDSAGRVLRVAQADGIVATREELPR